MFDVFELMIDDTDVIPIFCSEANSWSVGRMTSRRFYFPKRTGEGLRRKKGRKEGRKGHDLRELGT